MENTFSRSRDMSDGSVMWSVILVPSSSVAPPDFTCINGTLYYQNYTYSLLRFQKVLSREILCFMALYQNGNENVKMKML